MQGQRLEALASQKGLQFDLALSQLTSPMDGLVLEIMPVRESAPVAMA